MMNPEVEKQFYPIVCQIEKLCQTYHEAQLQCLTEKVSLPTVSRLFELIEKLERIRLSEIRRFMVKRGVSKLPGSSVCGDIKPEPLDNKRPIEIFKIHLDLEKKILHDVTQLSRFATDKVEMEVVAFLHERVILRLRKVVNRRTQQITNLERQGSNDITPMLVESLNLSWEIRYLEKRLCFEIERRCWTPVSELRTEERYMKFPGECKRF